MSNYKADITLNEKDSLQDMLDTEKNLVKVYGTAMTEGVSKNFRAKVKNNWDSMVIDQLKVFKEMEDHGYYEVQQADSETIKNSKEKYTKIKSQLA